MPLESTDQRGDTQCSGVQGEALTSRGDDDQGGAPLSPRRDRVEKIVAGRRELLVPGASLTQLYDCGVRGTENAEDAANHMWWLGFCSGIEIVAMEAHD